MMQRRKFLQRAALLPLPILLSKFKLSALNQPNLAASLNQNDDRVLVLLQLNGGNDGLNTVIPLDQYAELAAVRSNLILPESSLLQIEDANAFHPAMTGMRDLYDAGNLAIVQGVGYANQNRSHFRSTDIWNTGSDAETVLTEGWLGRHLDGNFPNYPNDYPTVEQPDPFAIVMGTSVSETCQGRQGNFSVAISNVDNVGQLPVFDDGAVLNTPYGRELDWLRTTIEQSNQYAAGIEAAAGAGNTMAPYPEENEVAAKLRDVARLISGGLKTKIYIVELGGFDTHAQQAPAGDATVGTHAGLLQTLSDAVAAFQNDLAALGIADRVLGMTYSEFGRRIRSNAGQGTDHGDAAPLFLFGSCVTGGITGANPVIDPAVDIQEGVPMQYDFRNVYGSVLVDWFGADAGAVRDILSDGFEYVPILSACNTSTSTGSPIRSNAGLNVFPNPHAERFTVSFVTGNERARLSLFDAMGRRVKIVLDQTLPAGEHRVDVSTADLPRGAYFVHLTMAGGLRQTLRVVKG